MKKPKRHRVRKIFTLDPDLADHLERVVAREGGTASAKVERYIVKGLDEDQNPVMKGRYAIRAA